MGRYSATWGVVLLFLMAGALPASAQNRDQRQIQWADLNQLIGKKMRIVMPDGVLIQGQAKGVQTDALALDIQKSGDRSKYPRGQFLVPRATLRTFSINAPRNRGKVIGLAVGGGVGAVMASIAFAKGRDFLGGYRGALIGGMVAVPVGGYLLGWAADRRTITYVISQ